MFHHDQQLIPRRCLTFPLQSSNPPSADTKLQNPRGRVVPTREKKRQGTSLNPAPPSAHLTARTQASSPHPARPPPSLHSQSFKKFPPPIPNLDLDLDLDLPTQFIPVKAQPTNTTTTPLSKCPPPPPPPTAQPSPPLPSPPAGSRNGTRPAKSTTLCNYPRVCRSGKRRRTRRRRAAIPPGRGATTRLARREAIMPGVVVGR